MATLQELLAIQNELDAPQQAASLDELLAIQQELDQQEADRADLPGAPVDPSQAQRVPQEPGFLEQGVSLAGEVAAGANRAILGLGDIAISPINVALQAAGQDRIPPLAGLAGQTGDIAGEGLPAEIASAVGELATAGLGGGTVLRAGVSRLPLQEAGETIRRGLLRQAGASTPALDVAGGALSGAGGEIGQEVGGETGRVIGGLAAPLATAIPAIPIRSAAREATRLLKKAAPSVDELKQTARGIYMSLDDSGVTVANNKVGALVDDISTTLAREGLDRDLTPKANALVNRLESEVELGEPFTLTKIDTLRKVAQNASTSIEPSERRLGKMAIDKIDSFLDGVSDDVISAGGDNQKVGQAFRAARDLWQRSKKSELLDEAVIDAQNQASGLENGLRTQFRTIAKKINRGKLKGYTKEELAEITKVSQGTNVGNMARFLGKFGVLDGVTSRSLTTLGGMGLVGGATASPVAAFAVPAIGQVSGALAQKLTTNNSVMANAVIRAGRNGSRIASAYINNTPKSERSVNELAQLFIRNEVPVSTVRIQTSNPLVSDAALIAAVANLNDKKEGEE